MINAIKEIQKKKDKVSPRKIFNPTKRNYLRGNNYEGKILYEKYLDEQEANMNPNYYGI